MEGLRKVNVTTELPGLEEPYQYLSAGKLSVAQRSLLAWARGERAGLSQAKQAAIDFQEARAPFLTP